MVRANNLGRIGSDHDFPAISLIPRYSVFSYVCVCEGGGGNVVKV